MAKNIPLLLITLLLLITVTIIITSQEISLCCQPPLFQEHNITVHNNHSSLILVTIQTDQTHSFYLLPEHQHNLQLHQPRNITTTITIYDTYLLTGEINHILHKRNLPINIHTISVYGSKITWEIHLPYKQVHTKKRQQHYSFPL